MPQNVVYIGHRRKEPAVPSDAYSFPVSRGQRTEWRIAIRNLLAWAESADTTTADMQRAADAFARSLRSRETTLMIALANVVPGKERMK